MPLQMQIGAYAAGRSFPKVGRCVRAVRREVIGMDKLFGMCFMEALTSAKREVKREENRKRRKRMSAETNAKKAVVCSVCRTYGGTLMNRNGGGYICRECRRKEKENETRNDG